MRIELAMNPAEMERVKGCCGPVPAPLAEATAARLALTMKALSDPARVQMLHMLAGSETPVCVCDFTASLGLGQATISHHLGKLREAGLISSEKQGIWSFFQLRADLDPTARVALEAVRLASSPGVR